MLALIRREITSGPYYQQNFDNDGQRFLAWYLRRVLLRNEYAARDDITDGKDDKQIDAVVVDDVEQRILVIQGKFITAGRVDAEPLREVLSAWLRLQDLGSLQKDCNERLKAKLEAIRRALEDDYRVEFELVTTGDLTDAARDDLKAFTDKIEDIGEFSAHLSLIDTETLELRLAEADAQDVPSVNHEVRLDPAKILTTQIAGTQTVIAALPLSECLKMPGITDGRLFRRNVRQSLGANNKVNRGLRATLGSEKVNDFFFYHNGITAICNSMTLSPDRTSLTLKGLSVVNGCQSLSTIYTASERVRSREAKEAHVLFRFYEIPDRGFGDRISINTNQQSAVKPRDLRSNDKIMIGLKRAFETRYPHGYFITKRGEERPADKDANQTVDAAMLAKMIMAWHCQRPNISYNEKRLFDEHYRTLFRTGYDPENILALQQWMNAIEEAWDNLSLNDVLKAGRTYVKFHILFAVSALIAQVNKQPSKVAQPNATPKALEVSALILPLAANCLEQALQTANTQSVASNKIFSPQNWLKTLACVNGQLLGAGMIAGMLPNMAGGKDLLDRMKAPATTFFERWSAD